MYDSGTIPAHGQFNFMLNLRLARHMLDIFKMPKIIVHLERKSRFLRTLVPINPCEDIRFGMIDYLSIGFFLVCFLGLIFTLAK